MRYTVRASKRRWPKRLLIFAAALVVLVLGATLAVRKMYNDGLAPVGGNGETVLTITVERGATLDQIAQQLKDAGLIRSPWAFRLYVGSKNVRDALQAGTYSFSPSQSVAEIVGQLTHGKVKTDLITIVPGITIDQVRTALVNYGFSEADIDTALNPASYLDHPALVDKPAGASLEGYIYPDSYQRDGSTAPQQIIKQALDEMDKKLTPDLRKSFASRGLSTYEAVTLASVVEREVSKPEDRAQVAQVFLKRLSIGMALESNATEHYFDSYNKPGLPPTPISNVTLSSLQAVANPAATDWLYFVSGDDGKTYFARTLSEHEANVANHCFENCGRSR